MVKLYEHGIYLLGGTQIAESEDEAEAVTGRRVSREEARKGTIAYSIMEKHNTSGSMEKLRLRFDAMASHDITFVGIIQTARASGMERFALPYVLTNCHNSLCAVGGTINEDDHMFGLSAAHCSHPSVYAGNACRLRKCGEEWQSRRDFPVCGGHDAGGAADCKGWMPDQFHEKMRRRRKWR